MSATLERGEHSLWESINLADLPEHRRSYGRDGYVYVLEFSTGIVKVGKTRNPRARIATHIEDARKFGASIKCLWLSVQHENYSDNERAVLRAHAVGDSVAHGNEYLQINFADAVRTAVDLNFRVLTDEQRAARDAAAAQKAEEFAKSFVGSPDLDHLVNVGDELTAMVLRSVFAKSLPAEIQRSEDREEILARVREFAERSGRDAEEVLNWSYTDVITHLAETVIRSGCLQLRIEAMQAERYDLTHTPFFGGVQ